MKSAEEVTALAKPADVMPIDRIPMDERRRFFIKIVMLMRVDMRELFGMEVANRWGFWVDRYLSKQVRDFADWIPYPKGDRVLNGHEQKIHGAMISNDGYLLFTGYLDGIMSVWNIVNCLIIREWQAHDKRILSLASRSGWLVSAGYDHLIKIWDTLNDYGLAHTLEGHSNRVLSVDINEKATQVVSGSTDKSIRIWSVKTGECIGLLMDHSDRVRSVQFIGNLILSGSDDKSIKVSNPSDESEIQSTDECIDFEIDDLSINSDASLIACTLYGRLIFYTWPELKYIRNMRGLFPYRCAFHPIHPTILAVNNDENHSLRIMDVSNYDVIRTLEGHSGLIRDLHFTPDGSHLVSVSDDKSVRIWDVSDM